MRVLFAEPGTHQPGTVGAAARRRLALALAILTPLCVLSGVVAITDRVFLTPGIHAGKESRAAVAIRDDVPSAQKWISKTFTRPCLRKYYNNSWYFTESATEDQKLPFMERLAFATQHHDTVDLFLLAHSNRYVDWVRELPPRQRVKIRLVYNSGCFDVQQSEDWLDLGIGTYIGHRGISDSPTFYAYFLRRWAQGYTAEEAVKESNARMRTFHLRTDFLRGGRHAAERLYRNSVASCHGETQQRINGGS